MSSKQRQQWRQGGGGAFDAAMAVTANASAAFDSRGTKQAASSSTPEAFVGSTPPLSSAVTSDLHTISRAVDINDNNNSSSGFNTNNNGTVTNVISTGSGVLRPVTLHPLQNRWTLWYDGRKSSGVNEQNWVKSLVEVKTVSTVEEFWSLFLFLKKPSGLGVGANYYFFKKGVKPAWEDPSNKLTGKWVIPIDPARADTLWENLLLVTIGERLEEGDSVSGIVLSKRRDNFKMAVWTKDRNATETNLEIGRMLRKELEIEPTNQLKYVPLEPQPPIIHTI